MDKTDWRLSSGQEKYLTGITLTHRQWRESRPGWNHDHCEFCWAEFAAQDMPDVLHEGWTTPDEYRWICETCFRDFRDSFNWVIVGAGSD
jgi:hypothetical protein